MPTLSFSAQEVIKNYLKLPIPSHNVSCPYYNNRAAQLRGGLRVLIGKGSPKDIAEEALIISLRDKIDLKKMTDEELRIFLVKNKLGVDCSGFAYYVLDAEQKNRTGRSLSQTLKHNNAKNPIRKLLTKFRPVENADVKIFSDNANSQIVSLDKVEAGDFIVMINAHPEKDIHHMIVITNVTEDSGRKKITYVHSLRWNIDSKLEHGVRYGEIKVANPSKPLAEQEWTEQGKTGVENETLARAKNAARVEIRRIK